MADVVSQVTEALPSTTKLTSIGMSALAIIVYFIIAVIVIVIIGVALYIILRNLKFNYKIVIFKKINNNWEIKGRDKAMEVAFGQSGDKVIYLQRNKKYLPVPEIQTGRKSYWYAIREDGEWINIGLEDIDFAMRKVKAKFLHSEMRYMRTALQRNLKERYDKPKFLEKYAGIIINIAAIVIIMVFLYLIVDKILTSQSAATTTMETATKVLDRADAILRSLDNICSISGIRTAVNTTGA